MKPASAESSRRWGLSLICAGQFVLAIDFTVANVALAKIQPALHFAPAELQWVLSGYVLTFGSLLIFGGRLGDLIGHRRLLLYALTLFGVTSLAAGLATSSGMLVVARIFQGAAAALVAPSALAMLTELYGDGHARARALGYFQGSAAAGGTAGIVVGGILTQYVGWRSVFLVNPPVVFILVLLVLRFLPKTATQPQTRLDLAGAFLSTASLAGLIFGLSEGQQLGFTSWEAIGGIVTFLAAAATFVIVERRVKAPMIPRGAVASPARRGAILAAGLAGAMLGNYVYSLVLFLQHVIGFSASKTGIALLPSPATVLLTSLLITRRLIARIGVKATMCVGLAALAAGQFELARMNSHSTYLTDIVPGLILSALGTGLVMLAATIAATSGVDPESRGLIGGIFQTAQQIGPAVGLAVFATIAAARSHAAGGRLVPGFQLSFFLTGCTGVFAIGVTLFMLRGKVPTTRVPIEIVDDALLDDDGDLAVASPESR